MTNIKMLQKVVGELQKEVFSKEYVLGILETILSMEGIETTQNEPIKIIRTESISDEDTDEVPGFLKPGPIGNINS